MVFGSARHGLHPEQRHLEPVLPGPPGPVILYQTLGLVIILVVGSSGGNCIKIGLPGKRFSVIEKVIRNRGGTG